MAVDLSGRVYVTGFTESSPATFPVNKGPSLIHSGNTDAFAARIQAFGSGVDYCGYLGGANGDEAASVALDLNNNAYLCGKTDSTDLPITAGPDSTFNGGGLDAFAAKISETGENILFCGYIGGNDEDAATAIGVDWEGNAYITGWTLSNENSFPVILGPGLVHQGQEDVFITKLSSDGSQVLYSGFIGGQESDLGLDLAVDYRGNAFVTGKTESPGFPSIKGPDATFNGASDAFVAKVSSLSLLADKEYLSQSQGASIHFSLYAGKENANRNYLILGNITGTVPGLALPNSPVILPLNWDIYTNLAIMLTNTPLFKNFMGTLNKEGQGEAWFNWNQGPLPQSAIGLIMNYAYLLDGPIDFASNATTVVIVP